MSNIPEPEIYSYEFTDDNLLNPSPIASDDEDDQPDCRFKLESVRNGSPAAPELVFVNEFAPEQTWTETVESAAYVPAKSKGGRKRKEPVDTEVQPAKPARSTGSKKPRKAKKAPTPESDDEDEPKSPIRAYLHLETVTTQPSRGRKPATTSTKAVQCPPFIFYADNSFDFFVNAVAVAAKTTVSNLTLSRLRWKFETPANLPMKVLSNSVGYDAMIDTVKERTKGHTIFLFLPKPVDLEAPATEVSSRNNRAYEYDEEPSNTASEDLSHKAQISALQAGFSTDCEDLERKFPIGNHILFPAKRIYTKNGLFWEMTSLRLDVWAAAIHAKRASIDAPPASNMFTKQQTIKPPRPVQDASAEAFSAYDCYLKGQDYVAPAVPQNVAPVVPQAAPPAAMMPYLPPPGFPPPYYPQGQTGPAGNISYYPPYPYPYYYPPPPPPPHAVMPHPPLAPKTHNDNIPSEFPSPGVTTKHAITLDQFCAKYNISASDSEKLAVLEYVPGNRIVESLTDTDYEKVGFGVLGWRTFLSHHHKFCSSIVAGTWPE